MKATIIVALVALSMHSAMADLIDNQIEENQLSLMRNGYSQARAQDGAHYAVQRCRACGAGECQVMGMQRFSEPRCEAFSGLGSPCRMWQEPANKTLHFPNKILYCNDVYMQFCPCARGLVCDEAECRRPRQQQGRPAASAHQKTKAQRQQQQQQERAHRQDDDGFEVEEASMREEEEEMPIAFEPGQSRFPWAVARFH